MGQFIDSIITVKQNYGKYDKWEQEQADERARKEYLTKNLNISKDKIDLTAKKSQAVIRATEILDKYSEDNCEDVEQATNMAAAVGISAVMLPTQFLTMNNPIKGTIFATLLGLGVTSSFILWGNSKQKEASRIGRYQAMQKDLKDSRNFVIYTPEQIQQAEENTKNQTVKKDKNNPIQSIKNLFAIQKDKAAYKEWSSNKDKDAIEKLKNRKLSKEQIALAQEDKELIVDTVKEINIKAEEYSENVENAFDTLGTVSFLLSVPAGWLINKALNALKAPGIYSKAAAFTIPIITDMSIMVMGTTAQKEAARVGRYQARKDLSENPARLMAYSEEDMKKAENITAPKQKKTVSEKISQSFSFLKQYYKDKKEYANYRDKEQLEKEKLQKALAEVKISDKQKEDAENLQKKVFMAFEEIDEMSQRYSEDVEAGSEIAKNIIDNVWGIASTGALAYAGYAFTKGKFPVANIVNKITNIGLKKESSIRIAVNNFYKALKDNNLTQKFQLSITGGLKGISKFIQSDEAKVLSPAFNDLTKELGTLYNPMAITKPEGLKSAIEPHLKQGMISKWFRNLVLESAEIYSRYKLKDTDSGKSILNTLPKREFSDYKTFIGTGAVAGLPIIGTIFAVPYMVNAWFTDVQKKAGKIGIMKAMEKIDDPRVFADENIKVQTIDKTQAKNNSANKKAQNNIFREFKSFEGYQ